jgi:hypothetical protein
VKGVESRKMYACKKTVKESLLDFRGNEIKSEKNMNVIKTQRVLLGGRKEKKGEGCKEDLDEKCKEV